LTGRTAGTSPSGPPPGPCPRGDEPLIEPVATTRVTGLRFAALLLDGAVVSLAALLAPSALGLEEAGGPPVSYLSVAAYAAFFSLLYRVPFEGLLGWTPGKKIFGVRVANERTGRRPGLFRALLRNLLRPLDGPLGLYLPGWLVAVLSDRRKRLGDWVAGTVVVGERAPVASRPHPPATDDRARAEEERALEAGRLGERMVSDRLLKLPELGHYHVFSGLKDERARGVGDIDHLVVGPSGLVLVETKADRGTLTLRDDGPILVDGEPLHRDAVDQARRQMFAFDAFLEQPDRSFRPARSAGEALGTRGRHWLLCFPRARRRPAEPVGERVGKQVTTLPELLQRIRAYDDSVLDAATVDLLAAKIAAYYGKEPDAGPSGRGTP
ncbi:MAG: RDD family protein, partial [Actinomycetota bacterium]|nr:RDD family protein [Actinomycetota bacterium]